MQGDRVSNETKEGAAKRFMKGVTRENKVKRYRAYGDKIPTSFYGNGDGNARKRWNDKMWRSSLIFEVVVSCAVVVAPLTVIFGHGGKLIRNRWKDGD